MAATGTRFVEEEQEKFLEEAKNNVKVQAFYMKRCLDESKLMDALKHASNMIGELRTSLLSPRNYNILYMTCCDELTHLEMFLLEEQRKGKRMSDLYEVVQYAGNILPRLYLVITVGAIYIKSKEAKAKDIIRDMAELSRGVQHPTRGLFLRNYLLQRVGKDKLPDVGNEYDGEGGSVEDSMNFILQNFSEMNKLWVRMQHQGAIRDRERREKERRELCVLVGTNLVRLSNLEGITLERYKKVILPRLLDEIVKCKDTIAQEYLTEVIIQVFPDELHIHTLDQLLGACAQLQGAVDLKKIIVAFIDRLANFADTRGAEIPPEINLFEVFAEQITLLIQAREMNLVDILTLQSALLRLALRCFIEKTEYANRVLDLVHNVLSGTPEGKQMKESAAAVRLVSEILTRPLEAYPDIHMVLDYLKSYKDVLGMLSYEPRKAVGVAVVTSIIGHARPIDDPDTLASLIELLSPLLEDAEDMPSEEPDEDDFIEEQCLVARVVPLLDNEDVDVLFTMYAMLRKTFGRGGSKRILYTLVPLVFSVMRLARRLAQLEAQDEVPEHKLTAQKLFHFIHQLITGLANFHAELALKLFLQAAQNADELKLQDVAYEFVTQALVLYDEEIEVKNQRSAVTLIAGAVQSTRNFDEENYETLAQKVTQCSAKLLKKPDQSSAVCTASHLYWTESYKQGADVLKCLQRSLRVADAWVDPSVQFELFTEILNHCMYYYEAGNEHVTPGFVTTLVDLIASKKLDIDVEDEASIADTMRFYENTMEMFKSRAGEGFGVESKI